MDNWPKASKTLREAPKKKTYLDEIIEHAKKEKLPAPGAYNLFKTQKEIDAEMKKLRSKKPGEKVRINYLDEVQYASNDVPGPGNYNPHVIIVLFRKFRSRRGLIKQNRKNGGRKVWKFQRKNQPKLRIWVLIILNQASNCLARLNTTKKLSKASGGWSNGLIWLLIQRKRAKSNL